MRFLIVGAGAVGGYFGARLLQSGADVTFLVRPTSADRLRREGLTIRSDLGDTQSAVATVTSDQSPAPRQGQNPFDVILLACKAYHLAQVIDDIRPWVAEDTAILPLLNGLRHLDRLCDAFGSERVLGGCCHIGVTRSAAGVIQHLNRLHSITFGELSGQTTMRLGRLAEAFSRTTLDAHPSDRILQEMWNKLVMLATFAGITCLMRAPIGVINACAEGTGLITALLEECETIAKAAGYPPDQVFMARSRRELTALGSPATASMLRDLREGKATEADHILGDLLDRAAEAGIEAPLLRTATCHLQAYEIERRDRVAEKTLEKTPW